MAQFILETLTLTASPLLYVSADTRINQRRILAQNLSEHCIYILPNNPTENWPRLFDSIRLQYKFGCLATGR